jgi:HSP20 family molecular chaperone IbpA
MKKRRSFFEKLTGATNVDEFDDEFEQEDEIMLGGDDEVEEESPEDSFMEDAGQLSIDVVNSEDEILIRAMIAGVKPQDLDIQISRDMVNINGVREESIEVSEEDYYHRELYWGSFSRNILLPEEVDVEAAEAKEKHGLLEIKLPKLDKNRKTKLNVKSG